MPRTRKPYPPEFKRQMIELVRAGRNPEDLARETFLNRLKEVLGHKDHSPD